MKAEIFNFSMWINIVDPLILTTKFEKLLIDSGFTIIDYVEHKFKPFGYTGLWLLAESHFALHTFPEEGKSYIELSSCNNVMYERFYNQITKNEF